ncbi:MAG: hypothetical protein ACHQRJ_18325, partial [Alphaproteobacteria bacterium]
RGSAVLDARFRGHDEFAVYRQRDSNSLKNKTNSRYVNPIALKGERVAQGWRGEAEPYPELGEGDFA